MTALSTDPPILYSKAEFIETVRTIDIFHLLSPHPPIRTQETRFLGVQPLQVLRTSFWVEKP
jgi:hypothetical protein